MASTTRSNSLYLPRSQYGSQGDLNYYSASSEKLPVNRQVLRSLSPDDVQKMKYKIELG